MLANPSLCPPCQCLCPTWTKARSSGACRRRLTKSKPQGSALRQSPSRAHRRDTDGDLHSAHSSSAHTACA
jgi:hypothetical protein